MVSTKHETKIQACRTWKKNYIEQVIDILQPSGAILLIGFEEGIAATKIQSFHPKNQIIIESNPEKIKQALNFSQQHKNVSVVEKNWQDALKNLGTFDCIFFNDYPLVSNEDLNKFLSQEEILQLTNNLSETRSIIEKELNNATRQFSNEEIEQFYTQKGVHNKQELPAFFANLKQRGNISEQQYQDAIHKYQLHNSHENTTTPPQNTTPQPMTQCLEICLEKHMTKGAKFCFCCPAANSKYEDPYFFEKIITNPHIEYHEETIAISSENNQPIDALVIIVTKV